LVIDCEVVECVDGWYMREYLARGLIFVPCSINLMAGHALPASWDIYTYGHDYQYPFMTIRYSQIIASRILLAL